MKRFAFLVILALAAPAFGQEEMDRLIDQNLAGAIKADVQVKAFSILNDASAKIAAEKDEAIVRLTRERDEAIADGDRREKAAKDAGADALKLERSGVGKWIAYGLAAFGGVLLIVGTLGVALRASTLGIGFAGAGIALIGIAYACSILSFWVAVGGYVCAFVLTLAVFGFAVIEVRKKKEAGEEGANAIAQLKAAGQLSSTGMEIVKQALGPTAAKYLKTELTP